MQNIFNILVDLKVIRSIDQPLVTQNDSVVFILEVMENGVAFDLTNTTTVSLAHSRRDGTVVVTQGTKVGNKATFELGTNETSVPGGVTAKAQFYDANGRVSTLSFSYQVGLDPTGSGYIPSASEQTLIEIVLNDGPLIIQSAEDAAAYANEQGDYALQVGTDNETRYLNAVSSVALRDSTYPTPSHGDTIRVTDTSTSYRYVLGIGWVVTDVYNPTAIDNLNSQLTDIGAEIGDKTTLPTWLQVSLRDVLNQQDNYLRQTAINIKQPPYNAKGDGTDETLTIEKAIADSVLKNVPLFFPTGVYGFTDIKLKNGLRMFGSDKVQSKLKHLGTGKAIYNNELVSLGNILISTLALDLNEMTTIGIEFARVYMSNINNVNITAMGCSDTAISFDEGVSYSAYYNSCYDVSINGTFNGVKTLGTGFKFSNSANSNRVMNCRTVNVKVGVDITTDYCNHNIVFGCAFESFDTAIRLNGDACQVVFNRFEAGTVGVEIGVESTSNFIIGNTITGVSTPHLNNNPDGNNTILDYGTMNSKYFAHQVSGGWNSNMDMRNFGIKQIGYADLMVKTTAPANQKGRLVYADGSLWSPNGDGVGMFLNNGSSYYKILTKRPVPLTATSPGQVGEVAYDATYAYFCTAANTWKRTAISAW